MTKRKTLSSRQELEYQKSSTTKFLAPSRSAYSLIELMVVIGIITIVGLTSFPSIFNRNDRLSLSSAASDLRQVIIDARTRSIAPDKNDSTGSPQQYQVVIGSFSTNASFANVTVDGGIQTNTVSLEKGMAQCDNGDVQGGFSRVRGFTLPRGIYVSSFYPTLQQQPDYRSVIRFTVGQEGFVCGGYNNPNLKSNTVHRTGWEGKAGASPTVARYMVVTLASSKIDEKRYVALDRITGEVVVSRTSPQSYFTPTGDTLAPRWSNVDPNNFTLSIACGRSQSDVTIGFPRAKDRVNDPNTDDPNLFVAYDINWTIKGINTPLAIQYFVDLSQDSVFYQFTTDAFTVANQPKPITVIVKALDGSGQAQPDYAGSDNVLTARQKVFNPSCGSVISDPPPDPSTPPYSQTDPPGNSDACSPIVPTGFDDNLIRRFAKVLVPSALAKVIPCT